MRYIATVLVLASCLVSCNSDRSSNPSVALHYPAESANAALYYGGQLRAPNSFVSQIDGELYAIRSQWQDAYPSTGIPFQLPWRRGLVNVWVDSVYADSFESVTWEPWASFSSVFGLSYDRGFYLETGWMGTFHTTEPLHSPRLADTCRTVLPGLIGVFEDPHTAPYGSIWTRMVYGNQSHFFFDAETEVEEWYRTDYFVIRNNGANYVGTHWELPPNRDSVRSTMNPYEYSLWLQSWIDSSRTQHPAWVDTAYMARRYWQSH